MAISFIGRTSGGQPNSGAVTLTLPGSMAVNDLIIVTHAGGDNVDLAMPTPTTAGYTDVGSSELYANGSTNDANSRVWYKFHNGSDTNVVLAGHGGGTNAGAAGALMVFRGVATAGQGGPFSTAAVPATGTGSTSANPASIATAAGDWVVICVSAAAAALSAGTAPTNYTTNAEGGTAGVDTVDGIACMAYRSTGLSNPEDPGAWSIPTSTAQDSWTAITLALKEAPAAADQDLTGAVFTKAPTFPTGTVTTENALTGAVFAKAPTFPTGTITTETTITGATFQKAPTFPTGSIAAEGGDTTLTGAVFTKAPTFPSGTLSSEYTLTGAVFTKAPSFPTGTVTTTTTITGAVFTKAPTFPTGTIATEGGPQSLTGTVFAKAPTFPAGSIANESPQALTGTTFTKAPIFPTGLLITDQILTGTTFAKAPTFPLGTITGGAITVQVKGPVGAIPVGAGTDALVQNPNRALVSVGPNDAEVQ